jgi:hypothetical protein
MTGCTRSAAGKEEARIYLADAAERCIEKSEREGTFADQAEKLRAEDKQA